MALRKRSRVLVIDDDQVARESARILLGRWGYDVALAANGQEGLDALGAAPVDLVVVDLQMPGIGGLEVLSRVRQIDPAIVCIMVTGHATLATAVEAMKEGAYDFLAKPFSPDQFKLAVARGLDRRGLALEAQSLRQEKERMEANFITLVSHQMRSPVATARQMLELPVSRALGPLQPEGYAQWVDKAAARLDELLGDLSAWLAMRSLDAKGVDQRRQRLEVAELLADWGAKAAGEAQSRGQSLEVAQAPTGVRVWADRQTLLEALYNLASNAVKYNRDGGVVSLGFALRPDHVELSVADQGPGIPEAELELIFDDFYRSKSPELKKKPGTGLGLAIARRVVELHGGEIKAANGPEGGAVFTVSLPLAPQEE